MSHSGYSKLSLATSAQDKSLSELNLTMALFIGPLAVRRISTAGQINAPINQNIRDYFFYCTQYILVICKLATRRKISLTQIICTPFSGSWVYVKIGNTVCKILQYINNRSQNETQQCLRKLTGIHTFHACSITGGMACEM